MTSGILAKVELLLTKRFKKKSFQQMVDRQNVYVLLFIILCYTPEFRAKFDDMFTKIFLFLELTIHALNFRLPSQNSKR